ncbi:hypothetical protein NA56DRAFT_265976 [Hyaloscypha hepaticicola]|uniref:Cora-domain-containing protein n=1 Tax=Hyaloscypha hepaticicola TaxID=2082293 RepID=A0A2J6PUS2_9HELO|nr:hypothetical protein NA56DRAFT_265976 [Hyaloscypha hepaticicola]
MAYWTLAFGPSNLEALSTFTIATAMSKLSVGNFIVCNSTLTCLDGFYHYFNEWNLGPLHTWFSYNVKSKSTTYLLFDCPEKIKERLTAGDFLPDPFAVDLLLAEECALWREKLINMHYQQIFNWHENTGAMDPPLNRHINSIDSMQKLHQLSRTWNMIYEDLGDLEERLDFLLSTSEKLSSVGIQTRAVVEYITFVRGRNHLRRRWVTSFGERTKLIINFVFSIEGEENSKSITFIAKETARDNNSMMTIATMTMLFLPGAFVASVLQIPTKMRLFWVVTIPATIFVLVIYQVWRWAREGRMRLSDPERGTDAT